MPKDKWFNKKYQIFTLGSLLLALCCVLYPDKVSSGPYLDSAHGKNTYGVSRTSISSFGYSVGNCAHCHEQHASIGGAEPNPTGGPNKYALFYNNHINQTDNICFNCHTDLSSFQTGGLINRSYSYRAGGYADSLNDIKEAFSFTSPATSHNLGNIQTFINGRWGFTNDSNPCAACHNPHAAKGDPANAPNSRKTSGARGYSPVSRPSLHSKDNNAWVLWGANSSERMNMYASSKGGFYQAPYFNGSSATYEPDGSTTQDGSNLTDFPTFCTDCHNNSNTIYSSVLGRNLYTLNFAQEMHGGWAADYCHGITTNLFIAPYDGFKCPQNYVLSCTDCHEPHGSPNNYLVRKQVNNGVVTVINNGNGTGPDGRAKKEWVYLCGKCHTNLNAGDLHPHPQGHGLGCMNCHPGGGNYRNCMDCHYHGNSSIDGTPYVKPLF